MLTTIGLLFLAYAIGSVPCGYLLVRSTSRRDVRRYGSQSVGAINVWRVGGAYIAALTLLGDVGKAAGVVVLAAYAKIPPWAIASAAFLVTIGQVCSVWFLVLEGRFSGGKGVACCLGVMIGLALIGVLPAAVALAPLGLWLLGLVGPRILLGRWSCISPATMAAALAVPVAVWAAHPSPAYMAGSAAIAGLILIRHHGNIRRLLAGTEPRLGQRIRLDPQSGPVGASSNAAGNGALLSVGIIQ
jgi:glycerol-3-phosphate acyltransferase PlsY